MDLIVLVACLINLDRNQYKIETGGVEVSNFNIGDRGIVFNIGDVCIIFGINAVITLLRESKFTIPKYRYIG